MLSLIKEYLSFSRENSHAFYSEKCDLLSDVGYLSITLKYHDKWTLTCSDLYESVDEKKWYYEFT